MTTKQLTTAEEIYASRHWATLVNLVESLQIPFQAAFLKVPQVKGDTRFSNEFEDIREYCFDSPFSCEAIQSLNIDKKDDQVQLLSKKTEFPAGRGVTFHAFDPLAIINALLKATPTTALEDSVHNVFYEKTGLDKSTNLWYVLPQYSMNRRVIRTFDGLTHRPVVNGEPLALSVKTDIIQPNDERYPLMRLYHDLLCLMPMFRQDAHPETFLQCMVNYMDSLCQTGYTNFKCEEKPRKVPVTINSAQVNLEFDQKLVFNYVKGKSINTEFEITPDSKNPCLYWYNENRYFNLPTDLVTDDMRNRAFEFENNLKAAKIEAFKKKYGENVPMVVTNNIFGRTAVEPADVYDEKRLAALEQNDLISVTYPPFHLSVENQLKLLNHMFLEVLRNSHSFNDVFNAEFNRLTDRLKELYLKTREMQILQLELEFVEDDYKETRQARIKSNETLDFDEFLEEIGYKEEEPPKPSRSRAKQPKEEVKAFNLADALAGSKKDLQTPTKQERKIIDGLDFFGLQDQFEDLEARIKAVRDEIDVIQQQLAEEGQTSALHFIHFDISRQNNQNCYIDIAENKKYFLFTSSSPTYIHLYEEPLYFTEIATPPPFYLQQYPEFAKYEKEENAKLFKSFMQAHDASIKRRMQIERDLHFAETGEQMTTLSTDNLMTNGESDDENKDAKTHRKLPRHQELLAPTINPENTPNMPEIYHKFVGITPFQREMLNLIISNSNNTSQLKFIGKSLSEAEIDLLLSPNVDSIDAILDILYKVENKAAGAQTKTPQRYFKPIVINRSELNRFFAQLTHRLEEEKNEELLNSRLIKIAEEDARKEATALKKEEAALIKLAKKGQFSGPLPPPAIPPPIPTGGAAPPPIPTAIDMMMRPDDDRGDKDKEKKKKKYRKKISDDHIVPEDYACDHSLPVADQIIAYQDSSAIISSLRELPYDIEEQEREDELRDHAFHQNDDSDDEDDYQQKLEKILGRLDIDTLHTYTHTWRLKNGTIINGGLYDLHVQLNELISHVGDVKRQIESAHRRAAEQLSRQMNMDDGYNTRRKNYRETSSEEESSSEDQNDDDSTASDDDGGDDSDVVLPRRGRQQTRKYIAESTDEESSDDEPRRKKSTRAKRPAKYRDSSSEEEEEVRGTYGVRQSARLAVKNSMDDQHEEDDEDNVPRGRNEKKFQSSWLNNKKVIVSDESD